jgi:ribonuclease T2
VNQQRLIQIAAGLVALLALSLFWFPGETPTPAPSPAPQAESAKPLDDTVARREPADFDYYVLVLSWSPTHCASDAGRGRDDDLQCRGGRPYGFVLHGLWPQHERGYPQNCPSEEPRLVSDALMKKMLEISPSEELVQHEWSKHGTCAGLSQSDYFGKAGKAFGDVAVPFAFFKPKEAVSTTPDAVRTAFMQSNPSWPAGSVAATCRRGELAEVWVCLDKELSPRACASDVGKRHCGDKRVRMRAVRGNWPR